MFAMTRIAQAVKSANTPYKYWRVVWLSSRTTDAFWANAAEVAFSNTPGGAQLAYSSVFASSQAGTSSAAFAFDNNPSSLWSSDTGAVLPQWIGVVFASATPITYLKLQAGDSSTRASRAPQNFRVEASNDGSNYVTIYTAPTQAAWNSSEVRNFYIGA